MSARRCVAVVWAAGIALATCLAEPSLAQVLIEGRVLDDSTAHPVARARVLLVNRYNKTTGYTLTDPAGRFRFEPSGEGWYRLEVSALGYRRTTTPVLWTTLDHDSTWLEVRLAPDAVLLAPVEVVGLSRPRTPPLLENVEHRRAMGLGYHLTRADIEERRPARLSDLLVTLPGVYAEQSRTGAVGRTIYMRRALAGLGGGYCPVQVFLEGKLVSRGEAGGAVPIDDLASPLDIETIEVFQGLGSIPPEFLTPYARCGVVAIWTRRSPP